MARAKVGSVLLFAACLAFQASAQPLIPRETCLEATVINADSVSVATLVKYSLSPDAWTIIDATFSIDEKLKGDVPKTLNIPIGKRYRAFHAWVEGRSQMLLIGKNDSYSVILLSAPDLAILRSDFTLLKNSKSIVRAIREICLNSAGVTEVQTVRLTVPRQIADEFPDLGMGMLLDVTIDERLERWAVEQSKSKNSVRRSEAAKILSYFRTEQNISILKSMLDDPAYSNSVRPNGNLGEGRRRFTVRQAAYDALISMVVYVEKPILDEEYFDPDAVTFIYLRRDALIENFINDLAQFKNLSEAYLSGAKATDEHVKRLADIPKLKLLHLDRSKITDEALVHIGRMKKLTTLNLSGTKITDAGLKNLIGLKSLELLDLSGTDVTDAGLADIAKLKSLQTLVLSNTKVTTRGLIALSPLIHLGKLVPSLPPWDLPDNYFSILAEAGLLRTYERIYTDGDLKALSDSEVREANLYKVPLTNAELKELLIFENLQQLRLSDTKVTDEGMKTVANFKHLTQLILNGSQITDKGIQALSGLRNIENLALADIPLTDEGLRSLASFSKIQWLVLKGTQITDDGLATLRGFKQLRTLIIGDTQVTDAGIRHILNLPALESLSIYGTKITNTGLLNLAKLKSLKCITVHRTPGVTSEGLAKFRRLRPDIELHG